MLNPILRRGLLLLLFVIGFTVMNYLAPLQPLSVVFDLALVGLLAGLLSMVRPLRFLDIHSRKSAAIVILSAILAGTIALLWPAPLVAHERSALIDEYMSANHVSEFHSELVHAPPERVYAAVRATTFADIKTMATLMQIRRAAAGKFNRVKSPPIPVLDVLSRPESGFVLLAENPQQEIVLGTAGRFWSTGATRKVVTSEDFIAYNEPGAAKSVFNMKVEDVGNGWTRLTTETRVLGNDAAGRRKMAAYWRVIYPGSATIRRMWLRAVKSRAERT